MTYLLLIPLVGLLLASSSGERDSEGDGVQFTGTTPVEDDEAATPIKPLSPDNPATVEEMAGIYTGFQVITGWQKGIDEALDPKAILAEIAKDMKNPSDRKMVERLCDLPDEVMPAFLEEVAPQMATAREEMVQWFESSSRGQTDVLTLDAAGTYVSEGDQTVCGSWRLSEDGTKVVMVSESSPDGWELSISDDKAKLQLFEVDDQQAELTLTYTRQSGASPE